MGHLNFTFASLLFLAYFVTILGVGVYLIVLATMFVKAHRRGAAALEEIANKLSRPGIAGDSSI